MKLKRNMETMKSICLTWFPISGFVEPNKYDQSVCFTRIGDFTWTVTDCEELVGLLTGDDGVGFSSSTETGPETSSSKFRDYCHPRRSNRDAHWIRLPDCFQIRYQGSIHRSRGDSMPSPFGQRTGYGPAYFRNLDLRCEYRHSRICCYLHLFGLLCHSPKARFQACQSSMRYWSQLGSSNPRSCWSHCLGWRMHLKEMEIADG